jgi:hypothetical protein
MGDTNPEEEDHRETARVLGPTSSIFPQALRDDLSGFEQNNEHLGTLYLWLGRPQNHEKGYSKSMPIGIILRAKVNVMTVKLPMAQGLTIYSEQQRS